MAHRKELLNNRKSKDLTLNTSVSNSFFAQHLCWTNMGAHRGRPVLYATIWVKPPNEIPVKVSCDFIVGVIFCLVIAPIIAQSIFSIATILGNPSLMPSRIVSDAVLASPQYVFFFPEIDIL